MENLNAEKIKLALKCHSDPNNKCEICPYNKKCCSLALSNDALALITSLEQRIKELTEDVDWSAKRILESDKKLASQREEIRRFPNCRFPNCRLPNCRLTRGLSKNETTP